jgi:hypothetical protein
MQVLGGFIKIWRGTRGKDEPQYLHITKKLSQNLFLKTFFENILIF